jgi:hypothetical protein
MGGVSFSLSWMRGPDIRCNKYFKKGRLGGGVNLEVIFCLRRAEPEAAEEAEKHLKAKI